MTNHANRPRIETYTFGTSHEPQEEYLETVPSPGESPADSSDLEWLKDKRLSEGEPTFGKEVAHQTHALLIPF